MSQSDDSLFSESSCDVSNDLPIVLGSRFQLRIDQFRRLDEMRVKLYVCHERQWKDLGTGHVMCHEESEAFIVFRLEDKDTNLFESMIRKGCVYTIQQDTLICWEEYDTEMALSFQDEDGCAEFYAKIGRILGENPANGQSTDDSEPSSMSDFETDEMPPLEISRLFEIENYIVEHMNTHVLRLKLSRQFDTTDFMPKLVQVFHVLEEISDQVHLKKLGTIAKTLLSMDNLTLLKKVLDDRYLKDVIGMLEYDESATKKVKHRSFVYDQSKFTEIVPIGDYTCISQIHKLYRLQYILDQCMPQPSILEENLTGTLTLYISNLRFEIFKTLMDSGFVKNLFSELREESMEIERRRHLLHLFVDFIDLGLQVANTQPQYAAVFSDFFGKDVLDLQLPCVKYPDPIVRMKSVEILDRLVSFNASNVLAFLHKQSSESLPADSLLNSILLLILQDPDPELSTANRVVDLMRNILSPEPPCAPERAHFLNSFYRISLRELYIAFLRTLQRGQMMTDDYHSANKAYCVVNLFTSCLQLDRARFQRLIEEFDVVTTMLVVLQSKHHFLALGGLRLLRQAVGFMDPVFDMHIVNNDAFAPVIECAKKNRLRENMLKSAIMELFSFLVSARHFSLIKYAVEEHGDSLQSLMPAIYEQLRTQYAYRHPTQSVKLATKMKEMKEKLSVSISIAKEDTGVKAENDGENTTSSVLKPKNVEVQVRRSLSDEEELGSNKKDQDSIKKEEKKIEVLVQKPLVDYADVSDSDGSDDQAEEEKELTEKEQTPPTRPAPGTPRPLSRASKRRSVVWDENDKPTRTQEAKKPCGK